MPIGKFTVDSRTVQVHVPRTWTDARVEALLDQVADAIDAAVGALATRLLELDPDLTVTSHQ